MDSGTFRGLLTLVLLLMFVGIYVWAWRAERKKGFEQAARLPLEDSEPHPSCPKEEDKMTSEERDHTL